MSASSSALRDAQVSAVFTSIVIGAIFGGIYSFIISYAASSWIKGIFFFSFIGLLTAFVPAKFSIMRPLIIPVLLAVVLWGIHDGGLDKAANGFIVAAVMTVCTIILGLAEARIATGRWSDFWRSILLAPDRWESAMGVETFTHLLPPLHASAMRGELSRARSILEEGGDKNSLHDVGAPIHVAAAQGHDEIVALFLDAGVSIESRSGNGDTPLVSAASNEKKEIVNFLIDKGADINASNNEGQTALHFAAHLGDAKLARFLKERGADLKAKTNAGALPMDVALEWGHESLARLLTPNAKR